MAIEMDKQITNAEWEVMRVIWAQGEVTSKVIVEVLENKRGWKEATTKTLIGRLVKKGALTTKQSGRKYIYQATIKEERLVNETLAAFFHNICSRDIGQTINVLIEKAMLSHDDIKEIKKTVSNKEKEAYEIVPCQCSKGQCTCNHG